MKFLKTTWLTICYPLLYLGAQVVVGGVYTYTAMFFRALWMVLKNPSEFESGARDPGELVEAFLRGMDLQMPVVLSCTVVLLAVYFINRRKWHEEGFLRLPKGAGALLPYCAAVGILSSAALSILMETFQITDSFPEYERLMDIAMGGSPALRVFAIMILAPLTEELVFRGLAMGALRERMKLPFAILISSVIFGAAHLNLLQGVYAAILGAMLAAIYVRNGTIWAAVFAHIGFNSVSTIATLFLDNEVVLSYVLLAMYLLSVVCVLLFHVWRRRRDLMDV